MKKRMLLCDFSVIEQIQVVSFLTTNFTELEMEKNILDFAYRKRVNCDRLIFVGADICW